MKHALPILALALAGPALAAPSWQFDQGEVVAYLHYGEGPESQIGLFCSPGFGTVGLYVEIPGAAQPEAGSAQLAVTASGQRFTFEAGAVQQGLQVMLAVDDPLMAALAGGGKALFEAEGKSLEIPLEGADFPGLTKACGAL